VFFLADAFADPVTQIEALKPWLAQQGAELARIFCVVDCQFAEKQPVLKSWYEACIHFSDVVFLTKRDGVANKWISDFLRHYEDECFPSLFIQLKKGGIANPALVLEPQPRRVSQYFDDEYDLSELVIETDDEEDDEDADDGLPEPDPYFPRHRNGRRVKELPDIREYLPAK
jgi:G3E family GTPase